MVLQPGWGFRAGMTQVRGRIVRRDDGGGKPGKMGSGAVIATGWGLGGSGVLGVGSVS